MRANDFSAPQRMSFSAFVIFFLKYLRSYTGFLFVLVLMKIFNPDNEYTFGEIIGIILSFLGGVLALATISAFLNYYFKKYYVEGGNLVFIHGVLQKEKTSIPLCKIQSLRMKRGFMYRLLDMRGVSFDTLASNTAEIELILDDKDWNMLFNQVEMQENGLEEGLEIGQDETANNWNRRLDVRNVNLIKGAFCQNHLKGMVILAGLFVTLWNQLMSVNDKAAVYVIDYASAHIDFSSFPLIVLVSVVFILYIVMLVLWIGKVFFQYFNMDIQMDEKQLFFESGLVSRNSIRFSYDKICTVYVKRNLIERWLNCCTIMLKQALNATDEKRGADVKIYGSNEAGNFLDWWLGKNYASSSLVASASSGYGLLGYVIRYDFLLSLLATVVLCYYGLYTWIIVSVVYLLVSLAKGLSAVRQSRITLKEDYLEVSNGKFAEVKNYFKYANVEVVRIVATPFTPHFHRVNLIVSTNGTSFVMRSLKEQEAREIYEWLLCRTSRLSS